MNRLFQLLVLLLLALPGCTNANGGADQHTSGGTLPIPTSVTHPGTTSVNTQITDASAHSGEGKGRGQRPLGISHTFDECMAQTDSDAIGQADCLTDERQRQDQRLNRIYKELIAVLQGPAREQLIASQRSWVQLQQRDLDFEATLLDPLGQMGNLQAVQLEAFHICERANRLESYLELAKLE